MSNKTKTAEIVTKNVKAYRFMLGLDYKQFAERVHSTPERIREMEQGKDVLRDGIELLRISEGCNVQYSELFDDEGVESFSGKNAIFPDEVWEGIYRLLRAKFATQGELAHILGVHYSTPSQWYRGKSHPGPFTLQNILTILKLKSYDLQGMVKEPNKQEEPEFEKTEIPAVSYLTNVQVDSISPDTFESKVIRIMRLQKELPNLVKRLDAIQEELNTLRNELSELL